MFDDFSTYFPILFIAIIFISLFSKAWSKRDLIKKIISHDKLFEIKNQKPTKSEIDLLAKIYAQTKTQYQKNLALAKPLSEINFIPITIQLSIAGFNLKLFLTNFNQEIEILYNFWVSFFLLLLNLPLFIYKENKKDIGVSLFLFFTFSLFCFPVLFLYQSQDLVFLMIGWFFNYTGFVFFSNSQQITNLKGQTVLFIIFWIFMIFVSVFVDIKFNLPEKYNYGYLINVLFFVLNAYFIYISQKYEKIDTN